jgi:hypothetical protein
MIGNRVGIGNAAFEYGAVTTVDINSQKVFDDVTFAFSRRFAIGSSATVDIVVDPTAIPSGKILVVLPVGFTVFGAGPINIDLYIGTDADADGTLWVAGNRDTRSSTTSDTIMRLNPTINNAGTKTPFEFLVPSDGVPAVASFGGQSKDDLILIADISQKYMFRLVNTEANAASALISFSFFEIEEA